MKIKYILILFVLSFSSMIFSQPTAPTNLRVSIEKWNGMKYVLLNWDESSSSNVQYFVYRKEGSLSDSGKFFKITMPVKNNSYKDKFVMRGKSYSYYVTAYNRVKESDPSNIVEISLSDSLAAVVLSGTVTDESTGLPVKAGKVSLIPVMGWVNKAAIIDSTGNYSCKVLPGKYLVYFSSPRYIPEFYDNANSIRKAAQVEITADMTINEALKPIIIPAKYALSGKVTDESGHPLKAFMSAIFLNRNCFRHDILHRTTDSLGNYSIPVRSGDSVVVLAVPKDKGYLPEFYNDKYELAEADRIFINKDTANIDFLLKKKPVYNNSISGKITDINGNSVMANVTLFKLRDNSHPKFKRTIITDSLGNFFITNIYPGSYIMHVLPEYGFLPTFYTKDGQQAFRWKDADSITVTETSVLDNINVHVLPVPDSGYADIDGKITDNNGDDVEGAMVYVFNENNTLVSFGSTDKNGSYSITNIAPGNYTIVSDKFNYDGSEKTGVTLDYSTSQFQTVPLTMTALVPTSVSGNSTVVKEYKLSQNYPNPFNPSTIINYQVPQSGLVTLKVYNIMGQEVATLVNEVKNSGSYNIVFNAGRLSSGVYFYRLSAGNITLTHKMTLIK